MRQFTLHLKIEDNVQDCVTSNATRARRYGYGYSITRG